MAVIALSVLTMAPAAEALTEARIVDVTCTGLTVVQTGLPHHAQFEVNASNAARGQTLAERRVRTGADGRLRVRLPADLHGVRRLHAEVERLHVHNSEYGEADVDLNRQCHVVGQAPSSPAPALPTPSATADQLAGSSGHPADDPTGLAAGWWALIGSGALLVATGGGLWWRKWRKLP